MPDLTEVLLRLAAPPLAPPDPLDALELRVRRRRRRRVTRLTLAGVCVLAVVVPGFRMVTGRSTEGQVDIATAPAVVDPQTTVPATPEHPAGRFLPTWLPGSMRIVTEQEYPAPSGAHATGRFRTYVRRGPLPFDQDILTISLQDDAAALDVEAAIARYAGAGRRDVQGQPALYLPVVSGRGVATLVWSPSPGRLAQVTGAGVTEPELAMVAGGFQVPPRLDATPLPEGFSELQRNDVDAFPAPVPLQFAAGTTPLRGGARPPGTPALQVVAAWDAPAPAGEPAPPVRGHPAVRADQEAGTTLSWTERPGLVVSVTGTNLGVDDVRRTAVGLREQSVEEVLGRPTGERVVLARGEVGGTAYELRSRGSASGPCLELAHSGLSSTCSSDPGAFVADFAPSIGPGMAFGPVPADATSVRLELPGGRSVETMTVGRAASQGAAFYVVALPPDVSRVDAVVALGPAGEVLRRTPGG